MVAPQPNQRGPSQEALAAREALKTAVDKELDKKRKLGHYYVWVTDHGSELIGPDAPTEANDEEQAR
ncbi:MAG: hypothetical protein EA402_07540 [Planctomycetota bacterium]|nr:MAG: hypothetical protein EA402_07540 [Planctomycetota bacterium]